jgi:hypothetical protein
MVAPGILPHWSTLGAASPEDKLPHTGPVEGEHGSEHSQVACQEEQPLAGVLVVSDEERGEHAEAGRHHRHRPAHHERVAHLVLLDPGAVRAQTIANHERTLLAAHNKRSKSEETTAQPHEVQPHVANKCFFFSKREVN